MRFHFKNIISISVPKGLHRKDENESTAAFLCLCNHQWTGPSTCWAWHENMPGISVTDIYERTNIRYSVCAVCSLLRLIDLCFMKFYPQRVIHSWRCRIIILDIIADLSPVTNTQEIEKHTYQQSKKFHIHAYIHLHDLSD